MFDGLISEEDVRWAAELMGLGPDGFAPVDGDDSRLKAMLRLDTVDFEACPGSGKTTLLVAKLAVLAMRWPHRQQGSTEKSLFAKLAQVRDLHWQLWKVRKELRLPKKGEPVRSMEGLPPLDVPWRLPNGAVKFRKDAYPFRLAAR